MNFEAKMNIAKCCFEAMDNFVDSLKSRKDCNIKMGEMQSLMIDGNIFMRNECMDKPKAKSSEWKLLDELTGKPEDDQTCLVAWKNCEGEYSQPVFAWWSEEENAFFDLRTLHSFPLRVDIWCPVPEMPEE